MKISQMSQSVVKELSIQWEKNHQVMADKDRDINNLFYMLTSDGGDSQWYVVEKQPDDDVVFYLRNVVPGVSAIFYALNLEDVSPENAKEEIRSIMREYDLRRLTLTLPAPVVELQRIAQRLGFWPEGRMKDATLYNGEYTDIDIFGFYRAEVEDGKIAISGPAAVDPGKPKKRRRRSRRKKNKVARENNEKA